MTLTKQHFKEIAKIIKKNKSVLETPTRDNKKVFISYFINPLIIDDLINYFKTENPLFDEEKFKEACLK